VEQLALIIGLVVAAVLYPAILYLVMRAWLRGDRPRNRALIGAAALTLVFPGAIGLLALTRDGGTFLLFTMAASFLVAAILSAAPRPPHTRH
jgi:hypothetical protein